MLVAFKAEERKKLGSAESKKIKKNGQIPAVIYKKEGNVNLSLNAREFEKEYFKGSSLTKVVEIELAGKKIKAIAHKIELDPVSDRPVHVDFIDCEGLKEIKAQPRVKFINREKSSGIKRGGFLHITKRRVDILFGGKIEEIPDEVEIDLNGKKVGDKIKSSEIVLPDGAKLKKKGEFLIASIIGRGKAAEEDKTTSATEGGEKASTEAENPAGGDSAEKKGE